MESYEIIKKVLALGFMNFLDDNKSKGKMCLSNGECEDIEKAFNEQDWPKLARYLDKYLIDGGSSETPKDLEEAAWQYAEQEVKTWGSSEPDDKKEVHDDFIAGAKWQKEQMLKKAVDAIVEDWNPDPEPEITIPLNPEEFTCGDKVRIIIVKED